MLYYGMIWYSMVHHARGGAWKLFKSGQALSMWGLGEK